MDINPVDILIHIVNIGVLYLILSQLVYKPVHKFMAARSQRVKDTLADAEQQVAQAEEKQQAYETLIAQADEKAKEILNQAAEKSNAEADRILQNAKAEADTLVAEGKKRAQDEYDTKIAAAKDQILDLSFNIAEKVLTREVTENDNKALVDYYFDGNKPCVPAASGEANANLPEKE